MLQKQILVGSHISSAGGLHLAFDRGESINCSVMQIFTKSGRTWSAPKIKEDEAKKFMTAAKKSTISTVVAHAGYLINLASTKKESKAKSVKSLIDELTRCEILKIPYLVIHPGSHLGNGEDVGIEQVAHNIEMSLDASPGKTMLLLETLAGQGTNLGYKFEHLKHIIDLCAKKYRSQLGVCFDTCHVFASGYDLATEKGYSETFETFEKIIGLDHLKVIHINDSFGGCGSKTDRHAPIGKGKIHLDFFRRIMNDEDLWDIPKILETPSDNEMKLWASEIKLLRSMVKS